MNDYIGIVSVITILIRIVLVILAIVFALNVSSRMNKRTYKESLANVTIVGYFLYFTVCGYGIPSAAVFLLVAYFAFKRGKEQTSSTTLTIPKAIFNVILLIIITLVIQGLINVLFESYMSNSWVWSVMRIVTATIVFPLRDYVFRIREFIDNTLDKQIK